MKFSLFFSAATAVAVTTAIVLFCGSRVSAQAMTPLETCTSLMDEERCSPDPNCFWLPEKHDSLTTECAVRCSRSGGGRGTCSDITYCQPAFQATASTSAQCVPKCYFWETEEQCYHANCVWYNPEGYASDDTGKSCRNKCSELRDSAACSAQYSRTTAGSRKKTTCDNWHTQHGCLAQCDEFKSEVMCNKFAGGTCQWSDATQHCHRKCAIATTYDACSVFSECEWTGPSGGMGLCRPQCRRWAEESSGASNCWKNGCVWTSAGFSTSGSSSSSTARCSHPCANIRDESSCRSAPMCGWSGTTCFTANCSGLVDEHNCERTTGCYWFGASATEGHCSLSCAQQFSIKKECVDKSVDERTVICDKTTDSTASAITGCSDVPCSNMKTPQACLQYKSRGPCQWMGPDDEGSCTNITCSRLSASNTASGPTACVSHSHCQIHTSGLDPNIVRKCISVGESLKSEAACRTTDDHIWATGRCKIMCTLLTTNDECDPGRTKDPTSLYSHCDWYKARFGDTCLMRCTELGTEERCRRPDARSQHCRWYVNHFGSGRAGALSAESDEGGCYCGTECEFLDPYLSRTRGSKGRRGHMCHWGACGYNQDFHMCQSPNDNTGCADDGITGGEIAAITIGCVFGVFFIFWIGFLILGK